MMRRLLLAISFVMFGLVPGAFSQAKPQTPPATTPPAEEPPPVLAVPKDYRYNPQGRRDPFVNPIPKPKAAVVEPPKARPPGLKGVMVREAQITGIVTSKEPNMNVVIISAPGARAAYFARVGDELFDAVVRRITLESVTFGMTNTGGDPSAPREVVRRVRPTPGENK